MTLESELGQNPSVLTACMLVARAGLPTGQEDRFWSPPVGSALCCCKSPSAKKRRFHAMLARLAQVVTFWRA